VLGCKVGPPSSCFHPEHLLKAVLPAVEDEESEGAGRGGSLKRMRFRGTFHRKAYLPEGRRRRAFRLAPLPQVAGLGLRFARAACLVLFSDGAGLWPSFCALSEMRSAASPERARRRWLCQRATGVPVVRCWFGWSSGPLVVRVTGDACAISGMKRAGVVKPGPAFRQRSQCGVRCTRDLACIGSGKRLCLQEPV
jgi:hypothetical protein